MEKLGRRFGRGRAVATRRRRGRLRGGALVRHPARRGAALMALRIAVLGDIHGNVAALEAALKDIAAHKPDRLVRHRRPGAQRSAARRRSCRACGSSRGAGALVIQGNTDIAVADGDYAAAFPWLDEVPAAHRAAADWAREQLSDDELDYLRRLPAERRAVGRTTRSCSSATPRPAARPPASRPTSIRRSPSSASRAPTRASSAAATPTSPTCASWVAS